jgi:hypothetical protein
MLVIPFSFLIIDFCGGSGRVQMDEGLLSRRTVIVLREGEEERRGESYSRVKEVHRIIILVRAVDD